MRQFSAVLRRGLKEHGIGVEGSPPISFRALVPQGYGPILFIYIVPLAKGKEIELSTHSILDLRCDR